MGAAIAAVPLLDGTDPQMNDMVGREHCQGQTHGFLPLLLPLGDKAQLCPHPPSSAVLQVPANYISSDPAEKQYVVVQAQSSLFLLEKTILVSPHTGYLFFQTDKAIYTPGQSGMGRWHWSGGRRGQGSNSAHLCAFPYSEIPDPVCQPYDGPTGDNLCDCYPGMELVIPLILPAWPSHAGSAQQGFLRAQEARFPTHSLCWSQGTPQQAPPHRTPRASP